MKTTRLIPALVLTVAFTAFAPRPGAQPTNDPVKEADAVLREIAGARAAAEKQQRKSLEQLERQLNQAQSQATQVFAASAPELKRAIGARYFNEPEPPLIVTSTGIEPAVLAEMQEDLNIMAKLIDNALADEREESSWPRAMGIAVSFWHGAAPARTLYVEGYGAVFQTAVRFPLAPTEKDKTATPAKPARNSAWDAARRELYAGPGEEGEETVGAPLSADERMDYSADRVESLKKSALKALANANNFRQLKPGERVTVVVRGGGGPESRVISFRRYKTVTIPSGGGMGGGAYAGGGGSGGYGGAGSGGGYGTVSMARPGGRNADVTLTISVKKSDADALAAGKISEEEFRKRAAVAVY